MCMFLVVWLALTVSYRKLYPHSLGSLHSVCVFHLDWGLHLVKLACIDF